MPFRGKRERESSKNNLFSGFLPEGERSGDTGNKNQEEGKVFFAFLHVLSFGKVRIVNVFPREIF